MSKSIQIPVSEIPKHTLTLLYKINDDNEQLKTNFKTVVDILKDFKTVLEQLRDDRALIYQKLEKVDERLTLVENNVGSVDNVKVAVDQLKEEISANNEAVDKLAVAQVKIHKAVDALTAQSDDVLVTIDDSEWSDLAKSMDTLQNQINERQTTDIKINDILEGTDESPVDDSEELKQLSVEEVRHKLQGLEE